MATYDAHVGDFGTSLPRTLRVGGAELGDLTGAVFSVRVTNPSGVVETWTAGFTGGAAGLCTFVCPDNTYWDEVGTWRWDVSYTLGGVTQTADDISLSIGPRGGTATGSVSGATTATALNAQIAVLAASATAAMPLEIVFAGGTTLTLDDTIDLGSHVHLRADGPVRVTRSDAPNVNLADDPTNAILYGAATVSATQTSLTAAAASGDTTLTVASSAGFAANDWVLVSGTPGNYADGGDAGGDSGPGLPLYALYRVASVPGGGVSLALAMPVEGYHSTTTASATACTVTKVTPVEDVRISGPFFFDCAGGTIAAAVSFRSCVNVRVEGCRFRGFSRAGVTADRGTLGLNVRGYEKVGETCSDVMTESCRHIEVSGYTSDPTGTRCHANGIPRHAIVSRLRDIGVSYHDCDIQNAQGGIEVWGAWYVTIADVHIRDCDPTERQSRAAATELDAGLGFGVGLDFGTTSVTNGHTAFAWDVSISNVVVEDVSCPNVCSSVYLHDIYHLHYANLSVLNHGRSPSAGGARDMAGVIISDVLGSFFGTNLTIRGVSAYALEFQNAGALNGGKMMNTCLHPGVGLGTNPDGGIYFNQDANGVGFLMMDGLTISNYATNWAFGAAFANYAMRFKNVQFDGVWRPIDDMMVVRNNAAASFNAYSLAEISNGGAGTQQVYVVASGGAESAKNVVVYSPTGGAVNSTFLLVGVCGRGKSNTIRTARDTAINAGDILVAGASGNAVVDNTPTNDYAIVGVAMTNYTLSGGATAQVPTM